MVFLSLKICPDTDSLIYTHLGDDDPLESQLGDYLGDLTSELPEGSNLVALAAPGPKAYAYVYKKQDGELVTRRKCRGMKMTTEASQKITFDAMKRQAEIVARGEEEDPITVSYEKIARDADATLFNTTIDKKFKGVFNKRIVFEDFSTYPFGYCEQ